MARTYLEKFYFPLHVRFIEGNMYTKELSNDEVIEYLEEDGKITFSNTAEKLTTVEVGKLFDRFYTVDSARKSTGLGLAIAKTLVEQMNGKIEAHIKDKKLNILIYFPD